MKQAKDCIVFPLDVASVAEAEELIRLLAAEVGMFKVGLELFIEAGPEIVRSILCAASAKVFLDLKLHDIPATVSRAMSRIADLGVSFATVHCGENTDMLRAAVEGSRGKTRVLGVTVLTSVSAADIRGAGFREEYASDLSALVMKRAAAAKESGCAGIVCSGQEVRRVKEKFGSSFVAVTPGIRPEWDLSPKDDQKRIVTPAQAIGNGSDFLVIGRPIRDAADPKAAAQRIAAEISAEMRKSKI
ncbi:MAG: orotidine-5'-phosphate decarboxylase [Desulfobacterales bacterium]